MLGHCLSLHDMSAILLYSCRLLHLWRPVASLWFCSCQIERWSWEPTGCDRVQVSAAVGVRVRRSWRRTWPTSTCFRLRSRATTQWTSGVKTSNGSDMWCAVCWWLSASINRQQFRHLLFPPVRVSSSISHQQPVASTPADAERLTPAGVSKWSMKRFTDMIHFLYRQLLTIQVYRLSVLASLGLY